MRLSESSRIRQTNSQLHIYTCLLPSEVSLQLEYLPKRYLHLLHALLPLDKHYQNSLSPSSMATFFNRHFAISAAVRFG